MIETGTRGPVARAHTTHDASTRGLIVLGVAAVVALAYGFWCSAHPNQFPGPRAGQHVNVAAGDTLIVGVGAWPAHSVQLRSVAPAITTNSADAMVKIWLCTPTTSTAGPIGVSFGALSSVCSNLMPVADHSYKRPTPADPGSTAQLVAVITPQHAGSVHIAGFDVAYHQSERHGHQRTGVTVDVSVRG